jgi:hypothetical protein
VAPFIAPIVGFYVAFVLLTWTADPLFNLILQCNRYGRYALSKQQRWSSTFFGVLLLGGIVALIGGLITGATVLFLLAGHLALLIIPATHVLKDDGGIDKIAITVVAAMALSAILAAASLMLGYKEGAIIFTVVSLLGLAAFTWFAVVLGMRRQKV